MDRLNEVKSSSDVMQVTKALQGIIRMYGVRPILRSDMTETLEKLDCLDSKTYALAMMQMYGTTLGSFFPSYKPDFPADIYKDWEKLSVAGQQADPVEYIFDNTSIAAKKLVIVGFIEDVNSGKFSKSSTWSQREHRDIIARQLDRLNLRAIKEKSWRDFPAPLIDAYVLAVGRFAQDCVIATVQLPVGVSIQNLKKHIEEDRKRVSEVAAISPDSKYVKLKQEARKRFKL